MSCDEDETRNERVGSFSGINAALNGALIFQSSEAEIRLRFFSARTLEKLHITYETVEKVLTVHFGYFRI